MLSPRQNFQALQQRCGDRLDPLRAYLTFFGYRRQDGAGLTRFRVLATDYMTFTQNLIVTLHEAKT